MPVTARSYSPRRISNCSEPADARCVRSTGTKLRDIWRRRTSGERKRAFRRTHPSGVAVDTHGGAIAGAHAGIALRVTAHAPAAALCRAYGGALVSTSANPHGSAPARTADTVASYFGDALDGLLDAPLGQQDRPTTIRDALTGATVRH